MLRIGAHMSVAGGVSNAVERAVVHGCESLQIFSKNANRWVGPPLDRADVRRFRTRLEETGITPAVSHASYLINLASTNPTLRAQSVEVHAEVVRQRGPHGFLRMPRQHVAGQDQCIRAVVHRLLPFTGFFAQRAAAPTQSTAVRGSQSHPCHRRCRSRSGHVPSPCPRASSPASRRCAHRSPRTDGRPRGSNR